MGREKMDSAVRIEDILRSIAVVHVPIHDQNSRETELFNRVSRRDGNVVKETESHRRRVESMMSWGTNQAEGTPIFSANHLLDGLDSSSRRHPGDVVEQYVTES